MMNFDVWVVLVFGLYALTSSLGRSTIPPPMKETIDRVSGLSKSTAMASSQPRSHASTSLTERWIRKFGGLRSLPERSGPGSEAVVAFFVLDAVLFLLRSRFFFHILLFPLRLALSLTPTLPDSSHLSLLFLDMDRERGCMASAGNRSGTDGVRSSTKKCCALSISSWLFE
jgi:hypothetical protein